MSDRIPTAHFGDVQVNSTGPNDPCLWITLHSEDCGLSAEDAYAMGRDMVRRAGVLLNGQTPQSQKTAENKLRRAAERQGLRLSKSGRRDVTAVDYGTYSVFDESDTVLVSNLVSLDDVERFLNERNGGPARPL